MKSKFETFNDGILKAYIENEDGKLELKSPYFQNGIRFGEENISIQRHYAAQAADTRVDRMVHVLYSTEYSAHDYVVINGRQYDIDKVDFLKNTRPAIVKLTLVLMEKHREKEFA